MPATPESVLRELALHLSYDAEVNGTKHTADPVGTLPLCTKKGALWKRIVDVLGVEPEMIRDVVAPTIRRRINQNG
ncbi:MAG: hypothetical protein Q7S32_02705 [bacterium]|nr:hypothetical protein [bacterium]